MNTLIRLIFTAIIATTLSIPAQATLIGGMVTGGSSGGSYQELSVPFIAPASGTTAVGEDTFQTNNLYAFNEDQNIVITTPITVDIGINLTFGTTVASHYIFFDPAGTSLTSISGYVDFDAKVLGILTSTGLLAATDFLANTGVTYLNPGLRGLESGDFAGINTTYDYRVDLNWGASTPGDYIRVLTERSILADVPEPSTIILFTLGIAGLVFTRRKTAYYH